MKSIQVILLTLAFSLAGCAGSLTPSTSSGQASSVFTNAGNSLTNGINSITATVKQVGGAGNTLQLNLANYACSNYASADLLFKSATAVLALQKSTNTNTLQADIKTEAAVALGLQASCKSAPFSSDAAEIASVIQGWATFVTVLNNNNVTVQPTPAS